MSSGSAYPAAFNERPRVPQPGAEPLSPPPLARLHHYEGIRSGILEIDRRDAGPTLCSGGLPLGRTSAGGDRRERASPRRARIAPGSRGGRLTPTRAFHRTIAGNGAATDLGRLLPGLTIGATFCVHGTQELFGWFGGYGRGGTGQFFESLGPRPATTVMITALRNAIWNEGLKPATGEHEVLLAAAALALTETGPGAPSLDSALGIERSELPHSH
jgi:uncharacterized membrane protein YphA (DoxX/SURF4 family)